MENIINIAVWDKRRNECRIRENVDLDYLEVVEITLSQCKCAVVLPNPNTWSLCDPHGLPHNTVLIIGE